MGRVYISSTDKDLVDERQAVHDAIRRLGHESVGMENYRSGERPAVDTGGIAETK